jgi:hypothetical protein
MLACLIGEYTVIRELQACAASLQNSHVLEISVTVHSRQEQGISFQQPTPVVRSFSACPDPLISTLFRSTESEWIYSERNTVL